MEDSENGRSGTFTLNFENENDLVHELRYIASQIEQGFHSGITSGSWEIEYND